MYNQKSPFKWVVLTVGTLFGIAHIGVLGHLINKNNLPIINLPVGDYTSYTVEAGEQGYRIDYSSNDPKVMGVRRRVDKTNGFFGIGGKSNVEYDEEYTMDGARHMGGGAEGKLTAKKLECIKAEGGGESTGRIVGASLGAAAAPWFTSIPYVGWVAAGWIAMFGQDKGAEIGGELATTMMEGCDEL